jgi:hypothetical protein
MFSSAPVDGETDCGCTTGKFCTYDHGETGICEACLDSADECERDGIPAKGVQDCKDRCHGGGSSNCTDSADVSSSDGTTAEQACLACGGGLVDVPGWVSKSQVPTDCYDTDFESFPDDCTDPYHGTSSGGVTAAVACLACGGGVLGSSLV